MQIARRFLVKGIVQGVGYRYFVAREARRLGLRGFVRNLQDRSVEVVVEGNHRRVEEFKLELEDGPPGAVVRSIEQEEIDTGGRFSKFEVVF